MTTFFKANCTRCLRPGKSKNPELYLCGVCYYTASARANRTKALLLMERADKLIEEAKRFDAKAEGYLKKWGPPPGVTT